MPFQYFKVLITNRSGETAGCSLGLLQVKVRRYYGSLLGFHRFCFSSWARFYCSLVSARTHYPLQSSPQVLLVPLVVILALLGFYNPLSIWVELVEVLHVGIIIKAALSWRQKRERWLQHCQNRKETASQGPLILSSLLLVSEEHLKPRSALTLPTCLGEAGGQREQEAEKGLCHLCGMF